MTETVENGAFVLERARVAVGRPGYQPQEVVLCHLPWNSCTPYATWLHNIKELGGDGGSYWGHYFESLRAAKADFNKRVEELT